MKNHFLGRLTAAALLLFHLHAFAEDIDLFTSFTPTELDIPNVLLIVDNTANWNQAFENEMNALAATVESLPVNKFRIGILFAAETGSPNNNIDGGYVRAAIRKMDASTKPAYKNLVLGFDKLIDKGNGGTASLVMAEAYRYFSAGLDPATHPTAGIPYGGNGKVKADYTGNVINVSKYDNAPSNAIYALSGNALASKDATRYASPITSACQRNFIIYISNGPSQDSKSVIDQAKAMLTAAGGSVTQLPVDVPGSQENLSDEWAQFMKKSDLKVSTYTIDVDPPSTGQGPGWSSLLANMARYSGGKYFKVSSSGAGEEIAKALQTALSEIQSINSVFAAVSLPVSVNTQGTYLNQVYVGMFRPDAYAYPRWNGNLKLYKMGFVGDTLKLLDAKNDSAINKQTGFITECARSFWTPATTDSYWFFNPQGGCLAVTGADNSNNPDGNIVEKGAHAYKLRETASRNVKTCSPSGCTALLDFNSSNVTQTMLGAASTTERDALIAWAKGANNVADDSPTPPGYEGVGSATYATRPSIHGDIVHSKPVAINFGTDVAPQVVVFYGGNDGMLRAVNGNRSASISTYSAGAELWAFMPPEFYSRIKRNRDNSPQVSYLGTDDSSRLPKPYGMDGAVTALKNGSSTWIYASMRRGGRTFYAFDVTTPASPSLKWKRGCPNMSNDTGCDSGFDDIGQTWSSLKPLKSSGYETGTKPMLIVGGGYDACEDADPSSCSTTKGNRIYVLDADTGELLKTMNTDRGIVGDIFVVEDFTTGLAKYAYAADLGGNLYRIVIGANAPADWAITKIAALGCDTPVSCSPNRKFMFSPDVVEDLGGYVLLIGSGDREKPVAGYTSARSVQNHFFMIKDQPANSEWLGTEAGNCGSAVICKNSLVALPAASTLLPDTTLSSKKGWYLNLTSTEQVVTSAITVFGTVTFSTHQPAVASADSCGSLGTALVYNFAYKTGKPANNKDQRYDTISGGGLPPSPIAGKVLLDDGRTSTFIIGASPDSALEGGIPPVPSLASQPKSKVYWYISK